MMSKKQDKNKGGSGAFHRWTREGKKSKKSDRTYIQKRKEEESGERGEGIETNFDRVLQAYNPTFFDQRFEDIECRFGLMENVNEEKQKKYRAAKRG